MEDREPELPSRRCPCRKGVIPTRLGGGSAIHVVCDSCRVAVRNRISWRLIKSWQGKLVDRNEEFEQDFYVTQLLPPDAFDTFDPLKGTFRAWLAGAADKYCISRGRAIRVADPFDAEDAEGPPRMGCAVTRLWALTLLRQSLSNAEQRWDRRPQAPSFESLRPFLSGPEPEYAEVARKLRLSKDSLYKWVSLLRELWNEELRALVDRSLPPDEDPTPSGPPASAPQLPRGKRSADRAARISVEIRVLIASLFDD